MTKFLKASRTELHSRLQRELHRSDRGDRVFDTLIEVLEETPEALSLEYSEDLLCDLVRSRCPDVTTQEIVAALDELSARAMALRELMQNKLRPVPERR
jgi:hypothetical protein